jgi:hypothetical protein
MTRWLLAIVLFALSALACQENGPGAAAPAGNASDGGAGAAANERLPPPPMQTGW